MTFDYNNNVYDKCMSQSGETTEVIVNVFCYNYCYGGQATDFTFSPFCMDWTCRCCCPTFCCSYRFEHPLISCGCSMLDTRNPYQGGVAMIIFANDYIQMSAGGEACPSPWCGFNTLCGNFNLSSLYTGTLSDSCSMCLLFNTHILVCYNALYCCGHDMLVCENHTIDGNILFNCCVLCNTTLPQCTCLDCTFNHCIEIKKLTGVNCYEICSNGISKFCIPLCSLSKWCLQLQACSNVSANNSGGLACFCIHFACFCTNDTNVCMVCLVPSGTTYWCALTAPTVTSIYKYKVDVVDSMTNGLNYYGTPAYIDCTYDPATPATWCIECYSTIRTDCLVVPANKKLVIRVNHWVGCCQCYYEYAACGCYYCCFWNCTQCLNTTIPTSLFGISKMTLKDGSKNVYLEYC